MSAQPNTDALERSETSKYFSPIPLPVLVQTFVSMLQRLPGPRRMRLLALLVGASLFVLLMGNHIKRICNRFKGSGVPLAELRPLPELTSRTAAIERLYRMGHMNWLDYLDTLDERGLAPLTKLAQRWIYEKQHPPKSDCKNRKFYVSEGTERLGLGAYLHKQGWGLAAALEANLIFVMNPVGTHEGVYDFADNCGTGSHNLTSLECFTQPLSSCTVEHAVVGKNAQLFREADWVGVDLDGSGVSFHKDSPPSYLKNKLAEHYSGVKLTSAFYKVWWRGQSAAYLSRLNAAMSDDIRKARKDVEVHRTWSHGTGGLPTNGIPYPMPAGTMNIHVRHGDKGSEMTLIPFETYVASAERYSSENPQTAFKRVFVSSEDPGVIDDAAKLPERNRRTLTAPDEQWQVFTSVIPRVNAGPYQQIHQYGSTVMTKSWYLQLWMALECDAYFGTRASNWNRIIDEFRCIYVDKCQLPYFEMGPENDWKDYYW